jgi:tRNA pseudouridine synthase 10
MFSIENQAELVSLLSLYIPQPTHAKVCIHRPAEVTLTRDILSSLISHDPESPYTLDCYPILNGFRFELKRSPLQLSAYYFKNSREYSQTPMIVKDGGKQRRIGKSSVEEAIAHAFAPYFYFEGKQGNSKMLLAGAGREDVDVMVLGDGRQFIFTIKNPTQNAIPSLPMLNELQKKVNEETNGIISLRSLKIASLEDKKQVSFGAEFKRKKYKVSVHSTNILEKEKILSIQEMFNQTWIDQPTPIRVAHRRPMLTRKRKVYSIIVKDIEETSFCLELETSAGFYIKEFIHSDLGRTQPNITDFLGYQLYVTTLDYLGCSYENDEEINSNEKLGDDGD